MMQQQSQRIITLFCSLLFLATTSAFSSRAVVQPSLRQSSSALQAGVVWTDDDNDSNFLMSRAIDCANSETCSLDEAQSYLDDMVQHIQKSENADAGTKVVADLRQKIEAEGHEMTLFRTATTAMNVVAGMYVVYAILHDVSAVPNFPVDAPMMAAFDAYTLF